MKQSVYFGNEITSSILKDVLFESNIDCKILQVETGCHLVTDDPESAALAFSEFIGELLDDRKIILSGD